MCCARPTTKVDWHAKFEANGLDMHQEHADRQTRSPISSVTMWVVHLQAREFCMLVNFVYGLALLHSPHYSLLRTSLLRFRNHEEEQGKTLEPTQGCRLYVLLNGVAPKTLGVPAAIDIKWKMDHLNLLPELQSSTEVNFNCTVPAASKEKCSK